jgi:hypothetical protein
VAYPNRNLGRQKVLYNSTNAANPLAYQFVLEGAKITPTSATITIYRPGSSTALVSAAAMTVSGSTLGYAVVTTTTASYPVETGYRADIAITYGGVVYARHVVFDVVRYLLDLGIDFDQLVAIDDGIRGIAWDGDEALADLITSYRDVLQARIESKVLEDDELIENMILDSSRVAVAARFGILAQVWRVKGNPERADYYEAEYRSLWSTVLGSIRYDKQQDGMEDAEAGGIQEVRLVT